MCGPPSSDVGVGGIGAAARMFHRGFGFRLGGTELFLITAAGLAIGTGGFCGRGNSGSISGAGMLVSATNSGMAPGTCGSSATGIKASGCDTCDGATGT
jgi:hypothetical protein